jgi:2-keto-3-deoxy-L-rhamnonate aldolase RhmA
MNTSFRQKLASSQKLLGSLLSSPSNAVMETLTTVGFDWIWIDMEHGPFDIPSVLQMLQAKSGDCHTIVRVPSNDETWIKRVLDIGAEGIIVPHVDTAEQARHAVACSKYPPIGIRSAGAGRAQLYGTNGNYVPQANDVVSVLVQIEHKDALPHLDEILAVKGIDAAIIGPYDLSGSMGKFGQFNDPEVKDAIQKINKACKKANVPCGIFTMSVDIANASFADGFQIVCLGTDMDFLHKAAHNAFESVKLPARV